uniref:F-box protein At4g21240 n=1 Tax=Nicotiana sylvestris TaxID=4096 RepID=A0A1U7YE48_NICSY|nr:PREDICTED: putative F-box protein At4g21240 [Nicotiana sylvestris]
MEEKNKIVVNIGNSCIPLEIIFDILIRVVPVKSLLRFRCVSKSFCSLISQPLFIETHQKTCFAAELIVSFPSLSFTRKVIIYKLVQKLEDGKFQAFPFQYLNAPCFCKLDSLESINGLVCLWNDNEDVAIINPFTKYHVFLPKSTERFHYSTFTRCFLGYDPSTKKYKVLKVDLVEDEKGHYKVKHWIFSLGIDESWREIHGWDHFFPTMDTCVYIDGVIYLKSEKSGHKKRDFAGPFTLEIKDGR